MLLLNSKVSLPALEFKMSPTCNKKNNLFRYLENSKWFFSVLLTNINWGSWIAKRHLRISILCLKADINVFLQVGQWFCVIVTMTKRDGIFHWNKSKSVNNRLIEMIIAIKSTSTLKLSFLMIFKTAGWIMKRNNETKVDDIFFHLSLL